MSRAVVAVLDTDPEVQANLRAVLLTLGVHTEVYPSGTAFLAALDRARATGTTAGIPVCVIADTRLPDMGGLELLDELARRRLGIPTILLAAEADVARAVEAMRAGALDFLEKPYLEKALINQIAPLLDERHG